MPSKSPRMLVTNCITLSVNCVAAPPKGRKNSCRMNLRSPRAPKPFNMAKLNTISGTSANRVVYARLMARMLISPPSQSRISAMG